MSGWGVTLAVAGSLAAAGLSAARAAERVGTNERLVVRVVVSVPGAAAPIKGIEVSVRFPKERLRLAPSAEAASPPVRLTLKDPESDDVFVGKQLPDGDTLRVVWAHQPIAGPGGLATGPLVDVEFERIGGQTAAPADVACVVTGASDGNGQKIDGVTCAVQVAS